MLDPLIRLLRPLTDPALAGFIKIAPDGRRVFFPWGMLGRGYVLGIDDEERLARHFALFFLAAVVLVSVGQWLFGYAGLLVAGVIGYAGYAVYARALIARLEASTERFSVPGAYRAIAEKEGSKGLLSILLLGAFLLCLGVAGIMTVPDERTSSVVLAVMGALLLGYGGWLRHLRRNV